MARSVTEWLSEHNIPVPNERQTRENLFAIITKSTKDKQTHFNSYHIANKEGHHILKTPPYHNELQPIEGVWGVAKQQVASHHTGKETMLSVHCELNQVFASITESTFLSLRTKT